MEPEDLLRFVVLDCEQLKLRYLVTSSTATIAFCDSKIDRQYIAEWAVKLGVVEQWQKAKEWK